MVEIAGGVSVPVVFFDGESESDIGSVFVYPSLQFKGFQSILSRKIGISPHQFSVYLAAGGGGVGGDGASRHQRRKVPITAKFNFSAISSRENNSEDWFFLVVLKRSRRERRRRTQSRRELHEDEDEDEQQQQQRYDSSSSSMSFVQRMSKKVPENVMLLRRNSGIESQIAFSPIVDRVGYENRVRELLIEREKYLANMGLTRLCLGNRENGAVFVNDNAAVRNGVVVCEECNRREVGFHWCVYDAVTFGFKSPAGPIARPVKGSD